MRALLLAAAFVVPASAQDAYLKAAQGPVSLKPAGPGTILSAKGGEELIFGDTIFVGKGGVAHVVIPGRGAVLLREQSRMTLEGTRRRTTLGMRFGEFLIGLDKRLKRGEAFRVRTPGAVAAVRGTLFWGKADKADRSVTYAGFGHKVAVTAKARTVILEPGKVVVVPFGLPPADPKDSDVTLETARLFAIDGDLKGLETLAEGYQPPKTP